MNPSLMPLEEARERILAALPSPARETILLQEASGRIALVDAAAPSDLPPFDNSSMDGYAVVAQDTAGANPKEPLKLRLTGRFPAGGVLPASRVGSGCCARVFTGSALPPGANAVVMQEDTREDGDMVEIMDSVKPWENVRLKGEDVRTGTLLWHAGQRLSPGRVAMAQALGLAEIVVGRRPVVGLIATGDELLEPGAPAEPGKIYESNRTLLKSLAGKAGAVARCFPIVADSEESTIKALEEAVSTCDLVITTGGASVGDHDWIKPALKKAGGVIDLWKIAVKPGKPFVFSRLRDRPVFGLPGNPVSALVTFVLLVRPALLRWQGARDLNLPRSRGSLAETILNPGPRRHFVRVRMEEDGSVVPSGPQASHMMSSLAFSSGLVDVPPDGQIAAGTTVEVFHWDA